MKNMIYVSTLQKGRKLQLGSIMYRYSKDSQFIDTSINRENLRNEDKIKFICPFTKKPLL